MTEFRTHFWHLGRGARLENRPRDAAGVHPSARAEWLAGWDWADTRLAWPKGERDAS
jgi:hypothetical protein